MGLPIKQSVVEGIFRGIRVKITNHLEVRIYNDENVPFESFKPFCDSLARYLISESYLSGKPTIKIQLPPKNKNEE